MSIFFRRAENVEENSAGSGPFDDLLEWMGSPEGVLFEQTRELVWGDLDEVALDEAGQRLVWEDEAALTIEQSAQRILDSVEPGQGVTLEGIEEEMSAGSSRATCRRGSTSQSPSRWNNGLLAGPRCTARRTRAHTVEKPSLTSNEERR